MACNNHHKIALTNIFNICPQGENAEAKVFKDIPTISTKSRGFVEMVLAQKVKPHDHQLSSPRKACSWDMPAIYFPLQGFSARYRPRLFMLVAKRISGHLIVVPIQMQQTFMQKNSFLAFRSLLREPSLFQ